MYFGAGRGCRLACGRLACEDGGMSRGRAAQLFRARARGPTRSWRALRVTCRPKPSLVPPPAPAPTANQVLPELQDADVDARPILKADALKFVTVFRWGADPEGGGRPTKVPG